MSVAMKVVFVLFLCIFQMILAEEVKETRLGLSQDMKAQKNHEIDSLNILIFTTLLILSIITIWIFKHRRLRFVHETGLAIIYGLIVGAIIRYSSIGPRKPSVYVDLPDNTTYGPDNIPDSLRLRVYEGENQTNPAFHQYNYQHRIDPKTMGDMELEEKATFDPEVFFNVLLPPIIFYAGYSMKRRHFFKNFGAIMTYAFLGTTISCFVVGGVLYAIVQLTPLSIAFTQCLFFGAIISATDPVTVLAIFNDLNVDVDLYAIVFGESVLNDAVAIVLSSTIENYESITESTGSFDGTALLKSLGTFFGIFFGAFAIGSAMGCLTALLTKFTRIRDFPLLETSLFVLMSYSTFLAAEAAEMTGIIAVLFCGITQAHYTYNNLSLESKQRTKQLFELLNFLMENIIFTYIGVSTFTFQRHHWDAGFISGAVLAVIIARACNIYPLTFLLNLGRSNKIRYNFQHMMMFSGLRGAIAFALAIRNTTTDSKSLMLSTTLVIVIATVILCGGFTTQMLQWLKIRVGVEEETELRIFEPVRTAMQRQKSYQTMEPEVGGANPAAAPPSTQSPSEPRPPEQPPQIAERAHEKAWLVLKWYHFDAKYVKPFLTHARPPLTETLPSCCMGLAKLLTTDEQITNTNERRPYDDSDTDLIIDENDLSYGADQASINSEDRKAHANNRQATGPLVSLDMGGEEVDTSLEAVPPPAPAQRRFHPEGESFHGDLGLGSNNHPLNTRVHVNRAGPTGDLV